MSSPAQPGDEPKPSVERFVVTRSEEELLVTTRRRAVRRARLVRDVEVETVTRTVEVHHDRAQIEYLPIDDALGSSSTQSAEPGEAAGPWLTLYGEEVVVTTRRVPRERVRLRVHSVRETREINETLRREQIDTDGSTAS